MQLSIMLAGEIFSMVLMILVGFFVTRKGLLDYGAGKTLSTLTVYVLCPCLIFSSCQIEFSADKLMGLGIGIIAAVIVHIIFIPMSRLLAKIYPMTELDRASVIYSNAGNLIVPLVGSLLGSEYVFYSSAYLVVQTVLFWTHGIRLVTGERGSIKNILLNPNIIATAAGLVFFFLPFGLPSVLEETVDKLGACIGPISMLSIGIIMSSLPLGRVFTDMHTYIIVFLRLLLTPAVFVLFVWITHITSYSPITAKVLIATVLAASGPTAVSITQNARMHGGDAVGAGMINVMSSLLCVITMPLIMMMYQALCG